KQGASAVEAHHLAGRSNDDFTVPVLGNDHRVLSGMQQLWPAETLRNPEASPVRRAAAAFRGFLDLLYLILDRLAWIPRFLEQLDDELTNRFGPKWWQQFGLPRD